MQREQKQITTYLDRWLYFIFHLEANKHFSEHVDEYDLAKFSHLKNDPQMFYTRRSVTN